MSATSAVAKRIGTLSQRQSASGTLNLIVNSALGRTRYKDLGLNEVYPSPEYHEPTLDPCETNISTLPNGMRVLSRVTNDPITNIGLFVNTGSRYCTPETSGIGHFLEACSGYGLSEGQCSEKACFADIERVFEFLTQERKINASKIILFGRSLGSGPTIHLASLHNNLAGMILQSPLRTAIKTQMPDWVGYVFKKIDIFTNEDKVPKIKDYPVFIIHGTTDNVVPYSHGKHLYSLLKKNNLNQNRVLLYSVEGCGHNDIEYRKGREFKKKLRNFIKIQILKKKIDLNNIENSSNPI